MMEISHHGLRQAVGSPFLCAGVGFTLWSFVRSMKRIQQVNEMYSAITGYNSKNG